jgi:hypothetical protein
VTHHLIYLQPCHGHTNEHANVQLLNGLVTCCPQQVYHLPIHEAAQSLGVGVTVLKKYCRRFDVSGQQHSTASEGERRHSE